MELTYAETREWIEKMLGSDVLDKEELLKFHRQIEVYNAHKVIAKQMDRNMMDVEFFLRSAIYLIDAGDQKLQLKAALGILKN